MSRIAVVGSGAWGTALALALYRRGGHHITLWSHSAEEAGKIAAAGENILFLPGFPLPKDIAITSDGAQVAQAEIVVSVIPSEFLRPTLARLKPYFHSGQIVVSATKGVENNTYLRMTQLIASCLGDSTHPGALSPGIAPQPVAGANPDTHLEVFTEASAPRRMGSLCRIADGIPPKPASSSPPAQHPKKLRPLLVKQTHKLGAWLRSTCAGSCGNDQPGCPNGAV